MKINIIPQAIIVAMSFLIASEIKADEMTDVLAPQYIYINLCKDWPPLPPDRLRTIYVMTEMVDAKELEKSIIKAMATLKLGNKEKTAEFCSRMATMIKNESGHEQP
jgi:hypothetical protein